MNPAKPFFSTNLGAAYLGDSHELLKAIPDESINLIVTSPPFALQRKKEYGNVPPEEYVDWFLSFADDFYRVLKEDGSFVIDIGGSWLKGKPLRSLYHYELLIKLCEKFFLAQEFFWFNPSKLPTPAEWVTVRRVRVKDAVNTVWWLSKSENPKADNRSVLRPYSESMLQLLKNGYNPKLRPSGHDISAKFRKDNKGAIPPNLLVHANTESNSYYLRRCREVGIKPHPARFPADLPKFFIKFLTKKNDLVLDPFAGSCVAGEVAEKLGRKWICFEIVKEYLVGAKFRFEDEKDKPQKVVRKNRTNDKQLVLRNMRL